MVLTLKRAYEEKLKTQIPKAHNLMTQTLKTNSRKLSF